MMVTIIAIVIVTIRIGTVIVMGNQVVSVIVIRVLVILLVGVSESKGLGLRIYRSRAKIGDYLLHQQILSVSCFGQLRVPAATGMQVCWNSKAQSRVEHVARRTVQPNDKKVGFGQ